MEHLESGGVSRDEIQKGKIMTIASIVKAAQFAAEKHKNQRCKDIDASPYINHPLALASVLAVEGGVENPDVICAAMLHDTVEDTDTTAKELAFTRIMRHTLTQQ